MLPTNSPRWKVFCHQLSLRDVSPISVSSSQLVILQRTDSSYRRSPLELEALIQQARESIDKSIRTGVIWIEGGYRCCSPLTCGAAEDDQTGRILQDVHHLVVGEIFTYLDTIQRAGQRRVYHLFDELISGTLSAENRLTYRQCRLGRRASCCSCSQLCQHYPLQAPLLKCLTARTRRIILNNGGQGSLSDVLRTLGICGQLGQLAAGQKVSVVAVQCDLGVLVTYPWGNSEGFWNYADVLAESEAGGYCKQLMLKQCSMSGTIPGLLFSGCLDIDVDAVEKDLYRLVECQLLRFDAQRTVEWVAKTVQGHSPDRGHILLSSNEFTTPDPRENNAYAGYKWTEDNLSNVDVEKLSRLTMYALSRHMPPLTLVMPPFVTGDV